MAKNYYILMTHGMGAHAMNVPEDLAGQKLERAELFICLPPDWKVGDRLSCKLDCSGAVFFPQD